MEVWVLEKYYSHEGFSDVLGVFENADVGMDTISNKIENIMWTEHILYWDTNKINDIVYTIQKFEVVLDEMPN
jgi:hypothetical protein